MEHETPKQDVWWSRWMMHLVMLFAGVYDASIIYPRMNMPGKNGNNPI